VRVLLVRDEGGGVSYWPLNSEGETYIEALTEEATRPIPECKHPLVEVLSTNGRNLDNAVRRCVECGVEVTP